MEATINKAQEKRDRQNFEYIGSSLRRKLTEFENKYLNSAVEFEFAIRKAGIKRTEAEIKEVKKTKPARFESMIQNMERRIKETAYELEFKSATLTMNALNEAKKSYDYKVNKVVDLLVKEGFGYAHFEVEQIKTSGCELAFLISKSDKEIHARVIWVQGVEVASHFRFITTKRNKK